MRIVDKYKLRIQRKRRRLRAIRRGTKDLHVVADRTGKVKSGDILLFLTLRNEKTRLPYFLEYYRNLGVNHFFVVDNGSTDGGTAYLNAQSDVSLWRTDQSYRRAGYGVHWLNFLKNKYADGHWCLVVDVDEFFVFPHCDTRGLLALTDWLDASSTRSFGAILLDMYPQGKLADVTYKEGECPIDPAPYFDGGNYSYSLNELYGNIWIQGGVRQRVFFAKNPQYGPALNKIPLVKWTRGNIFFSSTHTILPRGLNVVYDTKGGQRASGCLLHTKFVHGFDAKISDEAERKQHYAASREYQSYLNMNSKENEFYTAQSERYQGWQHLQELGLMSSGGWA